ncbi:MAG: HEAT repeat domain-containing protein, partial [Myxococcales bacterium]|nr:HEAT repeat domain-containing protein [Myxococcales bacterium]
TVVEVASRLLEPGTQDGRAVDVVKARVLDPTTSLGERIALCHLLGRTGSDRAQAVLLSLVGARPDALRIAALDALGELGRPGEAVDRALLGAFDDSSSRVRMAAATALGRVGQDAAAEQLLHRLDASAAQDRPALGVALSAALGRSQRPDLAQKVEAALPTVSGPSRDALLEGLGRMATPEALAALERASKSADPDDRRKVAEALGGVAGSESLLLQLSEDPDPTVRANASWALGAVGSKAAVPRLAALVEDLDVAVAGNAATGLGRGVGREAKDDPKAKATLCKALDDFRAYVRVGALNGLRFGGFSLGGEGDCAAPEVLRLLRRDGAFRVRLAAAQLLRTAPTAPGAKPGFDRALWRCASEDRDASVARLCQAPPPPPPKEHDEVTVYVVPDGKTDPRARAPFALVLADGALRLGVADRRGALYEDAAPRGEIRLAVPAALVH